MSRVVVHIDRDLSDLVPGFLARKREDAAAIIRAAEISDYGALASIGHKIKGEGGSYGLDAVSEIGAAVEQAAKACDLAAVRQCAQQLAEFLDNLEIVYD
ncbi:MAG TPA: Hpt domain-containing protein [Candidatus Binataceae bacterium]|nr:Hpt domain-containing protein [Candidatus Binataceae bacterium]